MTTERQQAIDAVIAQTLFHDDDPDLVTTIVVCRGSPACERSNPSRRIMNTCRQCERIVIGPEGNA